MNDVREAFFETIEDRCLMSIAPTMPLVPFGGGAFASAAVVRAPANFMGPVQAVTPLETIAATPKAPTAPAPQPTLKVWLQSVSLGGGKYSIQIWAQALNCGAGQGISDAAFTVFASSNASSAAPVTTGVGGKSVTTTWGSAVADSLKIPAAAADFNKDGNKDAVQACFGDTGANRNLGASAFVVCAETWTVKPGQKVTFSVQTITTSRHYTSTGAKVAFAVFDNNGVTIQG